MEAILTQYNLGMIQTIQRSTRTLPPILAIRRRKNPQLHEDYSGILVRVSRPMSAQGVWKFDLIENPLEFLSYSTLESSPRDLWFDSTSHTILVKRDSSRPEDNGKLYKTTISYSGLVIKGTYSQLTIPLVSLEKPCSVLSSTFMNLHMNANDKWRLLMKEGNLWDHAYPQPTPTAPPRTPTPPPTPPPVAQPIRIEDTQEYKELEQEAIHRIHENIRLEQYVHELEEQLKARQQAAKKFPQHIVNMLIETAVAQGKECFVLFEPLQKETAAITPCGHILSYRAAVRCSQDARSCPECRCPMEEAQLQQWSVS
jgi:hypothetical protein